MERRSGWALPPLPPESWVAQRWSALITLALVAAAVVPLLPLRDSTARADVVVAVAGALAGTAAIVLAYAALVQSSLAADRRLRAVAAVFGGLAVLVVVRSALERREAEGVDVAVVAVAAAGLGLAVRARTGRWGWLAAALAAVAAAAAARLLAAEATFPWWLGVEGEALGLALPGVVLGWSVLTGYRRQSRHWRRLEQQVRLLRSSSSLLPGRSITPEDDEGLPEPGEVKVVVEHGAVKIALQPVVDLEHGSVVGHEALSRFGGRIPTDRWFRAASRYGLGPALEQVTLAKALALLGRLPEDHFLSVNVSPAALTDEAVLQTLHAVDLTRVVVEITEHEAVADYPAARRALQALRDAGARIAVDDTGAGFASLRHVLMLQPDVIKLDASLSRQVDTDKRQQLLVTALTRFSREVGTLLLAEGVETQEQADALRKIGVPVGQGWHLGLPELQDD